VLPYLWLYNIIDKRYLSIFIFKWKGMYLLHQGFFCFKMKFLLYHKEYFSCKWACMHAKRMKYTSDKLPTPSRYALRGRSGFFRFAWFRKTGLVRRNLLIELFTCVEFSDVRYNVGVFNSSKTSSFTYINCTNIYIYIYFT
jgi:hypothetical protein